MIETGSYVSGNREIFWLKINDTFQVIHREDGPAIIDNDGLYYYWYYYDFEARDSEQFYDREWRRKIEIKIFL